VGDFTVDAKIITDYINLLPTDKVDCEQVEGELKISCQNYKTKINIQEAQDFPLIPVINKDKYYSVNLDVFKNAISQIIFAVANNDTRPELSGVLFVFGRDQLILTGTDSYRLAEKKIQIKSNLEESDNKIIVPARTLQELNRIFSGLKEVEQLDDNGEVRICLSESQILFVFGATEVVSRLINGNYPDYQQIIPTSHKTSVLMAKNELLRAIKTSAIFSKAGINDVAMEFNALDGKVTISSASSQVGENSVELQATIEGDNNEININYRYLLDGLSNINHGDMVRFDIINANTPGVLRAEKDDSYLYVVMPIRQ
jgi:DNA polymerase-3 subunit beta